MPKSPRLDQELNTNFSISFSLQCILHSKSERVISVKDMQTISFQVGDEAFQRFVALTHQIKRPTEALLSSAFDEWVEDLEDYLAAAEVINSNDPMVSLEEAEKILGLEGKI